MTKEEIENYFVESAGYGRDKVRNFMDIVDKALAQKSERITKLEKENAELKDQLTKAKKIIKDLCGMVRELNKPNVQLTNVDYSLSEAEQFLSEVEK